jgi:formylglycine-generating enzyme required for sulfatase activity
MAWIGYAVVAASVQAADDDRGARIAENSLGMKLILVPAGEFDMGARETVEEIGATFPYYKGQLEENTKDEFPRHRVRITKPFYLGQHEVTVGQFRQFVNDTDYKTKAESDGQGGWGYNADTGKCEGRKPEFNWRHTGFPQADTHPVVNVTWDDAVAFCDWLARKERKGYRLPTEAEWEYACRAGTASRYWSGNDPDSLTEVANVLDARKTGFAHVHELTIPKGADSRFTMPVGSFKPNAWELHDMHGNVWEWCSDWHGDDYYARSPAEDPRGPDQGKVRIRRGGAWNSFPIWVRASFRNWNTPSTRCLNLGFRVARSD